MKINAIYNIIESQLNSTDVIQTYELLSLIDSTFQFGIPCIMPIDVKEEPYITSGFGNRYHPVLKKQKTHYGIDIACIKGFQFIFSTADGIVKESGYNKGLGLYIKIKHRMGYESVYGHLSSIYAKEGRKVKIGEVVGVMGESGIATGVHLHYSILRHGLHINPLPYLTLYAEFKRKSFGLVSAQSAKTSMSVD